MFIKKKGGTFDTCGESQIILYARFHKISQFNFKDNGQSYISKKMS